MKRSILMSLLVIGAAATLIGAASLANYSDKETSKGNTMSAGSLDLQVNGLDDPIGPKISVADLKPSDKGEVTIHLTNSGSLPGLAKFHVANLVDDDISCPEPEGDVDATCGAGLVGELSAHIGFKVCQDLNCNDKCEVGETMYYNGKLDGLVSTWYPAGTVDPAPAPAVCIAMEWHVQDPDDPLTPADESNVIQTDKATFDIEFTLDQ